MKARKSKDNKIDRGHEIPKDDQDCAQIDSEEGNACWTKGSAKETSKLMEYECGDFYPKILMPPEGFNFFPLHMHYELKHDLRKTCRLVAEGI